MPTSDLINFKRGTSAALQALINSETPQGIDGCFYLTVDDNINSSKLYIGRADGRIVPVNQGIVTVANVASLSGLLQTKAVQPGDFAYATAENILAVYTGPNTVNGTTGGWIQLNRDEYIEELRNSITVSNGVATIKTDAWYNDTYRAATGSNLSTTFKVTGTEGIDVSAATSNGESTLTIQGDKYAMASAQSSTDTININLTSDKNTGPNNTTAHGTVTLKGSNNLHIERAQNSDEITFTAEDHSVQSLAFTNAANGGDGFVLTAEKSEEDEDVVATIDPVIKWGYSAATNTSTNTAHFVNGQVTIDTYSRQEIDGIKRTLDSMQYKGTVGQGGSAGSSWTQLSNVSIGDTYKVVGGSYPDYMTLPAAYSSTGSDVVIKEGDLLIATGAIDPTTNEPFNTEDSATGYINNGAGNSVKFDVVKSGDDHDTKYYIDLGGTSSHGISIVDDGPDTPIGGIEFDNTDTFITLTDTNTDNSTVGKKKKITIGHKDITPTVTTAAEVNNDLGAAINQEVITGITFDAKGHVATVTKTPLSIASASTTISGYDKSRSDSENVTTVRSTITTVDEATNYHYDISGTQYTSDNLSVSSSASNVTYTYTDANDSTQKSVTKSTPEVKINFVWGSF